MNSTTKMPKLNKKGTGVQARIDVGNNKRKNNLQLDPIDETGPSSSS